MTFGLVWTQEDRQLQLQKATATAKSNCKKQLQLQIQGSIRLRCSQSAVSNFAQDDVRFG
jgi:hypothetical protein